MGRELINLEISNYQADFNDLWLRYILWNCPQMSVIGLNPKETSWGLKGPVAYVSYRGISLKNRFLLKRYVFFKNIVLHNIMCETNWIIITTKIYRWKSYTKDWNGPLMPGAILVRNSNKMTYIYKKMP